MILANVAAAETLGARRLPLIYRMHDKPDRERSMRCGTSSPRSRCRCPKAASCRPAHFNRILERVKGRDVEKLVNEVVLRTQAQAEYAAENIGHFGLNLRRYAHFTSPIRRYADLLVHRALIEALKLGDGGLPEQREARLPRSRHRSRPPSAGRWRPSARPSTASSRICLPTAIGATFDGHISGVTRAGLFVKLDDTGADGFVPARTIGADEYFRYEEDRHALIGNRTGETYRLGDRVTVKLVEAAPVAGALRFELLSEGRYNHGGGKIRRRKVPERSVGHRKIGHQGKKRRR